MPPYVVLGLCSYTHDSAATLLVDGELIGFVEEERLSGAKHTRAYPEHAVAWLLSEAGVTADQVNAVAYNFHGLHYLRVVPTALGMLTDPATRGRALMRGQLRQGRAAVRSSSPGVEPPVSTRSYPPTAAPSNSPDVRLRRIRVGERGRPGRGQPRRGPDHHPRDRTPARAGPTGVAPPSRADRPGLTRLRLRRGHRAPGLAAR
ncbi:hypothetical protein KLK06_52290 [Nonomuraea sp. NEAU-A123]|nr:hypothetical protein [Nonomuraea sp. NEAU-A123]